MKKIVDCDTICNLFANVRKPVDYTAMFTALDALVEAMTIGWTQNIVILEAALTGQERAWYIQAANRFKWSKLELQKKIAASAHMEIALDNTDTVCYTEEKVDAEETSGYIAVQNQQCYGTGILSARRIASYKLRCPFGADDRDAERHGRAVHICPTGGGLWTQRGRAFGDQHP